MKVALIVLTCNSESQLENYLKSLVSEQIHIDEFIAIDSESKDHTVSILKEAGFLVRSIPQKEFDHGGSRQLACEITNAGIIIFTTHDVIFTKNCICNLLSAFSDDSVAAAYGRQLPKINADYFATKLRLHNYSDYSHIRSYEDRYKMGFKVTFLSDSFAAYKREYLQNVGGFERKIIFGEDCEIAARLLKEGCKVAYCADACVYHSHNNSIIQDFRRYFDVGVFHKQYDNLLQEFGKPESEGVKYVINELRDLIRDGKWHLIPYSFLKNSMKYLGYLMGKKYKALPKWMVKRFSMNRGYWK